MGKEREEAARQMTNHRTQLAVRSRCTSSRRHHDGSHRTWKMLNLPTRWVDWKHTVIAGPKTIFHIRHDERPNPTCTRDVHGSERQNEDSGPVVLELCIKKMIGSQRKLDWVFWASCRDIAARRKMSTSKRGTDAAWVSTPMWRMQREQFWQERGALALNQCQFLNRQNDIFLMKLRVWTLSTRMEFVSWMWKAVVLRAPSPHLQIHSFIQYRLVRVSGQATKDDVQSDRRWVRRTHGSWPTVSQWLAKPQAPTKSPDGQPHSWRWEHPSYTVL